MSGIGKVVQGVVGARGEELGSSEPPRADAEGLRASDVGGFDIEWRVSEDDGVARVGVGFEVGGEFEDAGCDES